MIYPLEIVIFHVVGLLKQIQRWDSSSKKEGKSSIIHMVGINRQP